MSRLLIVSNRLPVTIERGPAGLDVRRSAGGLATGLRSMHESSGGLWIGWSGIAGSLEAGEQAEVEERFRELRVVPVELSEQEVERYYEGYCNSLLWPLFHSFLGQLPLDVPDWPTYEAVNERFARAVVATYEPGDRIWIHDYQLMLLPGLLRRALPDAIIGFFLHIPFPAPDTFRTLPAREALLTGLLGADLIGFHTASYVRNFASSVLHTLGVGTDVDQLVWQGRASSLGVFPMGIDAQTFAALAVSEEASRLRDETVGVRGEQLLLGIDRLDYTKGIPRRLLAFERLLESHPELHGKIRLVQVAVPSRTKVEAYADFRNQVDSLVGRINGRFGTPPWAPVHYVYRGLSDAHVAALYRSADVMLVTPIRDGMNLVAKEFCAARVDGDGVLVLSEFAGAASELGEALLVNPYDIEGTAAAIHRALVMPEEERRARMTALRRRVLGSDVHHWAGSFVRALDAASLLPSHVSVAYSSAATIEVALVAMRAAPSLLLLLDYDGTLTPIVSIPSLARPDGELLDLLRRLAARPATQVHVVSGRGRDTLEAWLGELPIGLHAEHGFWSRRPREDWVSREPLSDEWRPRALDILREFAERTPGSLVEEKRSSLAWHYRMSDAEFGARQANELRVHLASLLSNAPVELLSGDKVVELRPHGSDKGRVSGGLLRGAPEGTLAAAFGDDVTDEDMFAALPEGALTFHLGPAPSRARLRIHSVGELRRLLSSLCG